MNLHSLKRIKPLYRLLERLRWIGGRVFMQVVHAMLGVNPKRVFFSSFSGKSYSDSPARISESLHDLRPDIEIVWQLYHPEQAPDYVRKVRPHSFAALRAISTARCLVDNFNRPKYMLKFEDQRYIQTWHGDRGLKKSMFDMEDGQDFPDGKLMDLAVAGSDFGISMFQTSFRYKGEILVQGSPRNDPLVFPDPKKIAMIWERLKLPFGVRILLYAPTFRNAYSEREQPVSLNLKRVLDKLQASTGEKWLCLLRAHDLNKGLSGVQDARVRDVTEWPDSDELLLVTDLLISDYSSIVGDFILLDRPLILFQPDLEAYIREDRLLYFDPRQSPFIRAETEDALIDLLSDIDALIPACEAVRRFYGTKETGHAAEAVARWISERMDGKK